MDLHIGYESVPAFQLKREDILDDRACKAGLAPKSVLKADKAAGRIVLDSETTLSDVPVEVWDYKLGNRSAGVDPGPIQGEEAEESDHPREVQHIPLC